MTIEQQFVELALSKVGCHYIWGGKGEKIFTVKGLMPHAFVELQDNTKLMEVFDCSGLVTTCLWLATQGRIDLRGTHGAKTMLDTFPFLRQDTEGDLPQSIYEDGVVNIYPGHVSISLGRNRVVEAAGGDESTTSIQAALDRGAKVRVGRDLRNPSALLGLRRIPLDKSELRSV